MRRIHGFLLAGFLPVAALAQDGQAVIRIEAKRGPAATAEAVEGWKAQFDDVVTFPLPRGWTGIALGPMSPAEAALRIEQLKSEGKIPGDSFLAEPGRDVALTVAPAVEPDLAEPDQADADGTDADPTPAEAPANDQPATVTVPSMDMDLNPLGAPPPAAMAPDHYMRLEAFQDRAEADAALVTWRETFPDVGLWQLPNDWFAIGLGPLKEETATQWLSMFKAADAAPGDAFTATTAEMGTAVVPGAAPDLPDGPEQSAEMPPLDEVQRALRWAGHYEGSIDGRTGPKTRAAINAEIVGQRLSPDPATAMLRLIERRADWRDEMGLAQLDDPHTGLSVTAPLDKLAFDFNERALSIYGPSDGSGAALILFSQPGGQQELVDLSGLVIALGWVPKPRRDVRPGAITLDGRNDSHISHAEGRVVDGRAEGFVLIWPTNDEASQSRLAAELSDSFARTGPAANDPQSEAAEPEVAAPQIVSEDEAAQGN
ncbi:peptidoglycan-binding domain-containing protein [Paracoccus tegillarcae]|uniref:peptidoglycan-binding domain-containing protein n=1 Tax=Paracoccus tegillarcae TaxID=1529068 RepID=UPI0018E66CA3|nr:peptidoglycan-binding domain-containing protein [Paracoccus tegillarcae]